jgi:hypothetical protein
LFPGRQHLRVYTGCLCPRVFSCGVSANARALGAGVHHRGDSGTSDICMMRACSFAHGAHELADSNSSSPQYSNYSSPQQNLSQDSNFDAQGALQPLHTDHPALFGVGLGGKDKHADDGDRRTRVSETSDPEGNAVSGEGIRAAGARMLVRDLLLKSQNEALTEELVAEHAKQMLKTASADGHSISLTEFVQYAGQHRALFDQLLLQQRSSAPCGTMTDVDAVNINGDTVPAPLVCSSSFYYRRRPRAACSVPVHAVCML